MTACTSGLEDHVPDHNMPEENTKVTFYISLPADSPAHGAGTPAAAAPKDLDYAVYDVNNRLVATSNYPGNPHAVPDPGDRHQFLLFLSLPKNNTYKIYAWAATSDESGAAQNFSSPYSFNAESRTVSIDYSKMAVNDHSMDAFFGKHVCHLSSDTPDNVFCTMTLDRPFARMNFLVNDRLKTESLKMNQQLKSIDIEVKQHPGRYTTLNLDNFLASNPLDSHTYHFEYPHGWDDLSLTEDVDENGDKFHSIATYFMLTGISPDNELEGVSRTAKELTDMRITVNYADGSHTVFEKSNVPIQRNCQTNIYGSLETTISVSCRLDTGFYGSYNSGNN